MKCKFSLVVTLIAVAAVVFTLRPPRNTGEYDVVGFGRWPKLVYGRI